MNEQEDRYQVFEVVIRMAVTAYERGGMGAVQRIGIEGMTEEDLQRFSNIPLTDIRKLVAAPVFPIVAVAVSSQMELMWKIAERRKDERQEQEVLILAGACLPLMASEYGMSGEEYAGLRQRLSVRSNGRPPLLSETEEANLSRLWTSLQGQPTKQRWLAIAQAGIPLHSAWATIQKERAEAAIHQEEDKTDPTGER